jgi:hypothetical protein
VSAIIRVQLVDCVEHVSCRSLVEPCMFVRSWEAEEYRLPFFTIALAHVAVLSWQPCVVSATQCTGHLLPS